MQPPVTVLTPVYNGARYLKECIESVIAQTYMDWEYIIVENCSTDDTYAIAKSYADRDSRIRIVRCDSFLPVIRNINRTYAHLPEYSQYCKPLMADDWLFPECLEQMVKAAEAHSSIGVVGCYAFDGVFPLHFGYPYPAAHVPGLEAMRVAMLTLGDTVIVGTPTAMLFRSDLVRKRKPFLSEDNYHCDHETFIDMLTESDFSHIHQVLCLNRLHEESQTSKNMWRLETLPAHEAYLLRRYGPLCLNKEEMQIREKKLLTHYYQRLAHQWFRARGSEFWDYHGRILRRMNVSLTSAEFRRAVVRDFLIRLSNPFTFMRGVGRRIFGGPRNKS